MNIKYIIAFLSFVALLLVLTGCDDFLDKNPDDRATLDSKDKIRKLLVSAYPMDSYNVAMELSSDNLIDNNNYIMYVKGGQSPKLSSVDPMHDEYFTWTPVTSSVSQDSPSTIWQGFYTMISVANHALEAIEELEAQNYNEDLNPQRGEALICRAYAHFVLANIFCKAYKDEENSKNDLGIPYITEIEKDVFAVHDRGSVADVYEKIEKDLEAGFGLISDNDYPSSGARKYHFNRKAAAAFAARFYLFKRDYQNVVKYANITLGQNPSLYTRDMGKVYSAGVSGLIEIGYDYIDAAHDCNLLVIPLRSYFDYVFGSRYGLNSDAMNGTYKGGGPTWSSAVPAIEDKLFIISKSDYGVFYPKYYGMFEYVDKVAQTGYHRVVKVEFSIEETLLCRAEALIYLNDIPGAVKDLEVWNKIYQGTKYDDTKKMTEQKITNFYRKPAANAKSLYVKLLNNEKLSPGFIITEEQEPFIYCVLHFRRIETMFDGYRWFDIKRYGIEIEHAIGEENRKEVLTYDDNRRALQLPVSVIAAGMEANPR